MLSKFFVLSCLDFGKLTCQDESSMHRLELAEWVSATGYYEEEEELASSVGDLQMSCI